jgi:hypothetical protein
MRATKAHRDTLYQEVWEEPISKLSIRYNISVVALVKVRRKLMVGVRTVFRGRSIELVQVAEGALGANSVTFC